MASRSRCSSWRRTLASAPSFAPPISSRGRRDTGSARRVCRRALSMSRNQMQFLSGASCSLLHLGDAMRDLVVRPRPLHEEWHERAVDAAVVVEVVLLGQHADERRDFAVPPQEQSRERVEGQTLRQSAVLRNRFHDVCAVAADVVDADGLHAGVALADAGVTEKLRADLAVALGRIWQLDLQLRLVRTLLEQLEWR